MKKIALKVSDLTVSYRNKPALWDIDLDIFEGSLTAIVGPNGAGKSTLLKAILDLLPKTSGQTLIFDKPYKKQKLKVGYIPQKSSIDWDFPATVFDVVLMGCYGELGFFKIPSKKNKQDALAALKKLDLLPYKDHQISETSGGQQQRTFLARALVQKCEIYLMDEPLAGVDAKTEKTIIGIFKVMKKEGKTLIVVHHDLQTLKKYFDHVIFLNTKVIANGSINKVLNKKNLKKTYQGKTNFLYDL